MSALNARVFWRAAMRSDLKIKCYGVILSKPNNGSFIIRAGKMARGS